MCKGLPEQVLMTSHDVAFEKFSPQPWTDISLIESLWDNLEQQMKNQANSSWTLSVEEINWNCFKSLLESLPDRIGIPRGYSLIAFCKHFYFWFLIVAFVSRRKCNACKLHIIVITVKSAGGDIIALNTTHHCDLCNSTPCRNVVK